MSETKFEGNRYEVVAWARNQDVVIYEEFGSYAGEWMMLSADSDNYYVYKGNYGSCSECDSYEAHLDYSGDISKESALELAKDYPSFIEIPRDTAANLARTGTLLKVMPANIRDDYSDIDLPGFCADASLSIKLREGVKILANDILNAVNQEIKQRALRLFGYERFVAEVQMEQIDRDGEAVLLKRDDVVFAYVKDGSSDRRYLLRVPPEMTSVRAAIAWTFGMNANDYCPIVET